MILDEIYLDGLPGNMRKKTFNKEERLCNKRSIQHLFHRGSSFIFYPFRLVFIRKPLSDNDSSSLVEVLISVPKRKIRKASSRNLVKRRMKEAYRHHKASFHQSLMDAELPPIQLAIQYLPTEILDFDLISSRLEEALSRVNDEYTKLYLEQDR